MLTGQEIRIAIIDDDEDDFFIISDYIQAIEGGNFRIDWCNNFEKAVEATRNGAYHIYFVDYRLGNHTGLDLLKIVCTEDFNDPIVLLTGKGNKEIDVKAMKSGATDYLIKSDLNVEKLERCIRYSLDRAQDLKLLKARENKYRNLFETSKDAVFILTDEFILKEVNESFTKLLNQPAEQLLGCRFNKLISDETTRDSMETLFNEKNSFHDMEVEIETLEGDRKSCLLSLSFLADSSGEEIVHGILHDITNFKRAEIANLQAHKLAMNERLMRTLAHEIRNPLNNISLSIEHFSMPFENEEEQKTLVGIMERNCNRINQIITELLDLTRVPELTFEVHNLQDILDDSIAMISDRLNLQKITLSKAYPSTPVQISANRSKLVIAFTNILINAIEAMESGKGELVVGISGLPKHARVRIMDNGRGIPEEYVSQLFEPFFTLKKNGIGLGLAASYSIIQSHNAKIEVDSKINSGTAFDITFIPYGAEEKLKSQSGGFKSHKLSQKQ